MEHFKPRYPGIFERHYELTQSPTTNILANKPFDRDKMKRVAASLAAKGVFVGTSSWKYEGWLGQLYTPARYEFRGKVAATRFKCDCLSEYAKVFKTVCLDSTYYTFPELKSLQGLASQVPKDFQFGFKVTGEIAIKKFPRHARHGDHADRGRVPPPR